MQVREKIIVCTPDGLKRREVLTLFDTGAKATCVSEKVGEELGFVPYKEPIRISLAVKKREAEVIGKAYLDFIVAGYELPSHAHVVKDLIEEAIIGTSFMEEYDIELDLKEGKVRLKKAPPELRLV